MHEKTGSLAARFAGYTAGNVLSMLGISAYILADTLFISIAEGADGITALNLVLPIYAVIYAIGQLIGTGSATRFKIARAKNDPIAERYLTNAVLFCVLFGALFGVAGLIFPRQIVSLMGGDERIQLVGTTYTRIFMSFAPFFMLNHTLNAFVRNDNDPALGMTAILSSSLFNIVGDYVLMFPCGLGMAGAAWATAVSPVLGILICCIHFFRRRNTLRLIKAPPSFPLLFSSCRLGVSAFMMEISSGVTTAIFNFLILGLAGNVGVAAYGVVANCALMATAIFGGIAQGSQPLLSESYGRGDPASVRKIFLLSAGTALLLAGLIILVVMLQGERIVALFNRESNEEMARYATQGIVLYFSGYLFAGVNTVGAGYFSAVEEAGKAFLVSLLRGVVAIALTAFVLAALFGMVGVWLAFPVAEALVAIVLIPCLLTGKSESLLRRSTPIE